MIHSFQQLEVGPLKVTVNWNEDVTPCKKIRFTLGDKEAYIDRNDLYALLVLFADEQQQTDLMPVISTKVRAVRRMLHIKAQKDIKKGEIINAPYEYYLPEAIVEHLILNDNDYNSSTKSTEGVVAHVKKL